jgi:transcriptional regulator with XRE-family HTH domain
MTDGGNDHLWQAMDAAGYSIEKLAEEAGFSPKQVGRWVRDGVTPRNKAAPRRVAEILGVEEADIWPRQRSPALGEIAGAWPHRESAPNGLWWDLLSSAREYVDLLGCAMLHIPERHPFLARFVSRQTSETGLKVRIMVLDPDGAEAVSRDGHERLGGTLPGRIRTTLHHFAPLFESPGVELRLLDLPLYNAVYRFDGEMLVTPYLFGQHGYQHPLLHLRQQSSSGLFAGYLSQFEDLWSMSQPAKAK